MNQKAGSKAIAEKQDQIRRLNKTVRRLTVSQGIIYMTLLALNWDGNVVVRITDLERLAASTFMQ